MTRRTGNGPPMSNDEQAGLSEAELAAEGGTALPDKEVVSILDLNADLDLAIDAAAPIDLAVAANANVAAPIDAAVGANMLSDGLRAPRRSPTRACIIDQGIDADATATSDQDSAIDQGDAAPTTAPTTGTDDRRRRPRHADATGADLDGAGRRAGCPTRRGRRRPAHGRARRPPTAVPTARCRDGRRRRQARRRRLGGGPSPTATALDRAPARRQPAQRQRRPRRRRRHRRADRRCGGGQRQRRRADRRRGRGQHRVDRPRRGRGRPAGRDHQPGHRPAPRPGGHATQDSDIEQPVAAGRQPGPNGRRATAAASAVP